MCVCVCVWKRWGHLNDTLYCLYPINYNSYIIQAVTRCSSVILGLTVMEPLYLTSVDPLTKASGMLVARRVLDHHTVSRARATPVLVSTLHNLNPL